MESHRAKNGRLFVIAVCLVLIVLKLFSVDFVRAAEAVAPRNPATASFLFACVGGRDCAKDESWVAVRAAPNGTLAVNPTR